MNQITEEEEIFDQSKKKESYKLWTRYQEKFFKE